MGISLALMSSQSCIAVEYSSVLASGQSLRTGDSVISSQGLTQLIFQSDNNLVLYQVGTPYVAKWDRFQGTLDGKSHAGYDIDTQYFPLPAPVYPPFEYPQADMQPDGNLVISVSGTPVWASGTAGYPGASLTVQDDARLVIAYHGKSIWSSNTDELPILQLPFPESGFHIFGNDLRCVLLPGETLQEGDFLASRGYSYSTVYDQLILQNDGNLVQYERSGTAYTALWSTLTGIVNEPSNPAQGPAQPTAHGDRLIMTQDGDVQLIDDSQNRIAWHSGTDGCPGSYLDADSFVRVFHQELSLGNSQVPSVTPYRLLPNELILTGDYLRRVVNQVEYTLILQNDGNLVFYSRPLASGTYTALWSTITGPIGRATATPGIYGPLAIGNYLDIGLHGAEIVNFPQASTGQTAAVTWTPPIASTGTNNSTMEISDLGILQVLSDAGVILWRYTD